MLRVYLYVKCNCCDLRFSNWLKEKKYRVLGTLPVHYASQYIAFPSYFQCTIFPSYISHNVSRLLPMHYLSKPSFPVPSSTPSIPKSQPEHRSLPRHYQYTVFSCQCQVTISSSSFQCTVPSSLIPYAMPHTPCQYAKLSSLRTPDSFQSLPVHHSLHPKKCDFHHTSPLEIIITPFH